jgi:WD40 repeat protein
MAAGCSDGGVRVWSIFGGLTRLVDTLWGHTGAVQGLAFSRDGRKLLSRAKGESGLLWDLRQDAWDGRGPLAFKPDGDLIFTRSGWDGAPLNRIPWWLMLRGPDEAQTTRPFLLGTPCSPDEREHLTCLHARPWQLEVSPDGETLYMALERNFDTETQTPREDTKHRGRGRIEAWSLRTRKLLWSEPHPHAASVALTPDGSRLLASSARWQWRRPPKNAPYPDVVLREANTGRTVATLPWHHHTVWSMAVSPDSARAVSAGMDGTFALWDLKGSTKPLLRVQPCADPLPKVLSDDLPEALDPTLQNLTGATACAISPDGKTIAVATGDGRMRLWDMETFEHLTAARPMPQSRTAAVFCAFLSPTVLVTAYQNGRVEIVDTFMGGLLRVLNAQERVTHAALSPDGRWLVVATSNKRCFRWNLTTPEVDLAAADDPVQFVRNLLR